MKKHLLRLTLVLLVNTFSLTTQAKKPLTAFELVDPTAVEIIRDSWGVPHIYAKHDYEVAYGLAWANAEDAFPIMQETLLTGKGRMGEWKGKEGVIRDYLLHSLGIPEIVEEKYETDFSPEFRKYLDGYCQGLNAYAAAHPEEVIVPGSFPTTPKELVQSYVFTSCYISYVTREIGRIVDGTYNHKTIAQEEATGSNAYAFSSGLTADGKTYLAINPHQPMEGAFSWYEAHLQSEEGLNIHGALFHLGPTIFLGNNRDLGWSFTYNGLDLVDAFELEMHPEKKNQYLFDGEYLKLEKKRVWLKVKLHKLLTVSVPKVMYFSAYGPTYRKGREFYSVRLGANQNITAAEQLYRMNKATSFEAFSDALELRGVPRFNVIYADKEDNIMYLCNGLIPERKGNYAWDDVVPGKGSETLWTDFIPLDELPRVQNPASGFVFNTNNTPFNCSGSSDNPDKLDKQRYPDHAGYRSLDNNRSLRFVELVHEKQYFEFEDFVAIKFDKKFPENSRFLASMEGVFALDTADYPHIAASVDILRKWNREASAESPGATLFALTVDNVFKALELNNDHFYEGFDAPHKVLVQALEQSQDHLLTYFQKLDVPLGEFQRIIRGDTDLPLPGYFDMLAANYSQEGINGRYEVFVGDSYTQFAVFGEDGLERLETLHPYGASSRKMSPHYTDQMHLFTDQQTKTMSLDREVILKDAQKRYAPGIN